MFVIFPFKIFYLRSRERDRQTDQEHPSTGLIQDDHSSQAWTNVKARSQELNPDLLCGWQEPSYLNHHLCLQGSALAVMTQSMILSPSTVMWTIGILNGVLIARLDTHPNFRILKPKLRKNEHFNNLSLSTIEWLGLLRIMCYSGL